MSFEEIVMKGKFFYPTYSHNVQCDKCFRNSLVISIGYFNRDLCLNCAENIAENLHMKKKYNPQFPEKYLTRMESIIYHPIVHDKNLTLMMKDQRYNSIRKSFRTDLVECQIKKIDNIRKELKDK
jgi:hypothetical protein